MEKEIFTSIENAGEIKVPEYLSDKIDDAIRAQRPLKRSLKWTALYYASAAAAVMLVFTMIWNAVSLPESSIDTNCGNSAVIASYSSDTLENNKPHMIPVRPEMTDENKTDTPETAIQSAKVKNRLAATSPQKRTPTRGNVRIVTDQEGGRHDYRQSNGNHFRKHVCCRACVRPPGHYNRINEPHIS